MRHYLLEEVQLQFNKLHSEITQQTEITQDGINISSTANDLQTLLENKLNTDYELSPVCVEAIKLASQAIFSNVGANYSLESYSGTSFSEYALETLSVFVKELWTKVKTSIQNLWDKVSQFWEDNFSALKSVRKSLDHAYNVIQKEYKVTSERQAVRISETLLHAFNAKKDLDGVMVESFINTHLSNFERLDEIIDRTRYFNNHARTIRKEDFEKDIEPHLIGIAEKLTSRVFKFGHDVRPIIGGEYISVEYNFESGSADMKIDVDKNTLPVDMDKRETFITDQNKLKSLIKRTIDVVDETIKYTDERKKVQKEFDDLIRVYDKLVLEGNSEISKNVNKTIKLIYKINSCMPGFFSFVVTSNVKLAKSVMTYAGLCLKKA